MYNKILTSEERDAQIRNLQGIISEQNTKYGIFGGPQETIRICIRKLEKLGCLENETLSYEQWLQSQKEVT